MDNLRYIRETMERATPFTGISGRGEIAIGVTALVASVIAAQQATFNLWLAIWVAEGLISLLIAGWSMDRKARAAQMPLFSGPGRKAVFSLSPPIIAGGLLTIVLVRAGLTERDSGCLASALRHRRDHRRHVLGQSSAGDGSLFHGPGRDRSFQSSGLCQLVYGQLALAGCICFWCNYCEEIRWLSSQQQNRKRT